MGTGRGAKREMVIDCIRHLSATFRYADVERTCPGVSRPTIVRVLGELRDNGEIRCTKSGRDATWERTTHESLTISSVGLYSFEGLRALLGNRDCFWAA